MLVAQAFIDIRHYIIPDEFSIYAAPFGIVASVGLASLGYSAGPTWQQSVLGAVLGAALLGGVMLAFWLVRRTEGMGLGDVKLLAMIGAFLGALPAVPFVLFVSAVSGSVVGVTFALLQRKGLSTALPYGPFLGLGAVVWLLHGPELVSRWLPALPLLLSQ